MERNTEGSVRVDRPVMRVRPAMFRFGIWLSCWAEVAGAIVGILTLGYWCPGWEMDVLAWSHRSNGRTPDTRT